MKRCGYTEGYCWASVGCCVAEKGWPNPNEWRRLNKLAKECEYLSESTRVWQSRIHILRRRRDWEIGDPYVKGGGWNGH